MKKVYILVDERNEPLGGDLRFFVFDSKEKAIAKMNERRNDFLSHEDRDYIEVDDEENKRRQDEDLILDMWIVEEDVL